MPFIRNVCDRLFGSCREGRSGEPPAESECKSRAVGGASYGCSEGRGDVASSPPSHPAKVSYYDIIPPRPVDGRPEFIEIRRVYCFDCYHFEPEPSELETIFATLPGYRAGGGHRGRWA
jgi:hypothetical protein